MTQEHPMTQDHAARQEALVSLLVETGALRTAGWVEAFRAVPRHRFLGDRVYVQDDTGRYTRWRPLVAGSPEWLDVAYQDRALVTQLDGAAAPSEGDEPVMGVPTSSSSMPTVVALMMEELQAEPGHTVLEIGTGTGWSTALLAARLGDQAVTSVELDPVIGSAAAAALHGFGAAPTLSIGDGLAGHAPTAPFDRIVSTCSARAVPAAWLSQSAPRARIVTSLRGWMEAGGLLVLTVGDDGVARGGFADSDIGFMFARAHTPPPIGVLPAVRDGSTRVNGIGTDLLTRRDERAGRWILQLALPGVLTFHVVDGDRSTPVLHDPDTGSTAWVYSDHVVEAGPEQLWARAEGGVRAWRAAGSPPLRDFRVMADGRSQTVSHPGTQG